MFNLGFSEIVIIGVLALLLIGPKQLPEMARVLGRMMNEFKKATSELSGGLLDIKNDLQKPLRDGLDEISRIRNDVVTSVLKDDKDDGPTDEKTVKIDLDDIHYGETAAAPAKNDDEPKS